MGITFKELRLLALDISEWWKLVFVYALRGAEGWGIALDVYRFTNSQRIDVMLLMLTSPRARLS